MSSVDRSFGIYNIFKQIMISNFPRQLCIISLFEQESVLTEVKEVENVNFKIDEDVLVPFGFTLNRFFKICYSRHTV